MIRTELRSFSRTVALVVNLIVIKMKNHLITITIVLLGALLFSQSCEKEENEMKVSSHDGTESHHAGENCMGCHSSGGEGEGRFTLAGTVYNIQRTATYPNATLSLYSGPQGTGSLKLTLEVDAMGNFYTTEAVNFGDGLYPAMEGNTSVEHMNQATTTGQCNSCHGTSTERIWTE